MEQIDIIGLRDKDYIEGDFYIPIYFYFKVKTKDISRVIKLYVDCDGEIINKITVDEFNIIGIIKGDISLRIQYLNNEDRLYIQDEYKVFFEEIDLSKFNIGIYNVEQFTVNLEIDHVYIKNIANEEVFFSACLRGEVQGY